MSTNPVRIGVVGVGGMGGRHARNLAREVAAAKVVAVMDVDAANLAQVGDECGADLRFSDANALIDHADVDAVLIAAPDRFHAELAKRCIAAGKPVLCEKPLATTAAEARTVIDAEVAGGRRLVQLGFMREYDPAHVAVKRICDSGELGRVLVFRGMHNGLGDGRARTIEDVITNSAIHDIHSARWLMDDEIVRVYTSAVPAAADCPDTARFVFVQLHFAGGTLGLVDCNVDSGYGYEVDVQMTGERGIAETNSLRSAGVRQSNNCGRWVEDDWLQRFDTAYVVEVREWVDSIVYARPSGPSAWDGYISMLVADACIRSAKSGAAVDVDVLEMPELYK
jgi:myo-inositol 2-dehydrogenase / D-chiro-inositol 1-dehydrogenase